jgi:hypothetical protein
MAGSQEVASLHASVRLEDSQLKKGLVEAKTGLSKLEQTTKDAAAPFKTLSSAMGNIAVAAGVATAAVFAFKQAFDFAKQGAELDYTAKKFDRMAAAAGTTSDVLIRDLRSATRGVMSDAQLMASASDLMALGLAKTGDEAVRLAKVAGGLGMNMNQLVLTLTNQTTMRFDALGVSVDGFEAKVNQLKASGMDANAAFKEAFLQQAEAQLQRVGERADTTAGNFDRLAAAWGNWVDAVKQDMSGPVGDVVGWLADQMEADQRLAASKEALVKAHQNGIITVAEMRTALGKAQKGTEEYGAVMEWLVGKEMELMGSHQRMVGDIMAVGEAYSNTADTIKQKFADLATAVADPVGEQMRAYQKQQDDLMKERGDLSGNVAFLQQGGLSQEEAAKVAELKGQIAELDAAFANNAAQHELATKRILFDLMIQKIAAADLTDGQREQAYQMAAGVAEAWGIAGQATIQTMVGMDSAIGMIKDGNIEGAIAKAHELKNVFLGIQGDYYVNFRVSITGQDLSKLGVAGAAGAVNVVQPSAPKGWGGGGGSTAAAAAPTVPKKTKTQMLTETANALSSVGSIAQQMYQTQVIDPLKKKIDNIDSLMTPGHIDLAAMDKTKQLMEERAQAAKEIEEAEKKILELQKAQQKLQLLEAQMRLLDLIKENKLNKDAILGGIQLGTGADMGGVIEATTRALDAIIGKLEGGKGGLSAGAGGGGGNLNWKRQEGIPEGTKEWEDASKMTHKEWKAKYGINAASGFSGVVPSGFPNDSFGPIWASSGESISIVPGGQKGNGGTNISVSISVPAIDGRLSLKEVAYEVAREIKYRI